jgi:hypothetical protein
VGKRGRPPVLDDAKKQRILRIVGVGCSRQVAARFVGRSRATIRNTANRDPEFAESLRQAAGNAEITLLRRVRRAAKKDQYWRAAAWALERGFPERYGLRRAKLMTIEQVRRLMKQLALLLVKELPAARDRKRILECVEKMVGSLGRASLGRGLPTKPPGTRKAPDDPA